MVVQGTEPDYLTRPQELTLPETVPQRFMKCPICKKEVKLGDPEMPFCSERCRLIDLGMWSAEEYRIPGPSVETAPKPEDEDDE